MTAGRFGFWRHRDGVRAEFDQVETAILRDLAGQVSGLLRERDRSDPAVARLFPDAHRDDRAVAAAYRELVESDLRAAKTEAVRALAASVAAGGPVELTGDDAEQWLQALNDIRLALGTRLGITEDPDEEADEEADPDDPAGYVRNVYHWLGEVQETLVDALSS